MRGIRGCALLIVTAGLLVGCASRNPVYAKPGVTESVRKADEAACVKASIGVNQPAQPATTPAVDREAFAQCMQAKGYVLQAR
jgi:hypothetical protein